MNTQTRARITKDVANRKISVIKDLDADISKVWKAYTDSKQLDMWWAPKPWKAETKEMNFKEGGKWIYSMVGPEGERHWAKMNFHKIDAPNLFTATDTFTDEKGTQTPGTASMQWTNSFKKTPNGTRLTVDISFDKDEDMKKILEMGFEEGFQMGLENLDELLAK